MEKEKYPNDLPTTFIRGYIRSYGKLLQIPEYEIKKAIEPIKSKPNQQETTGLMTASEVFDVRLQVAAIDCIKAWYHNPHLIACWLKILSGLVRLHGGIRANRRKPLPTMIEEQTTQLNTAQQNQPL